VHRPIHAAATADQDAPRVPVLMPVRDAAATLAECLDSIAAQTLAAW